MLKKNTIKEMNENDEKNARKLIKQSKTFAYIILYMMVLGIIIIGEIVLFRLNPEATLGGLFQDMLGNLMGVLAAFLVFDIAHEKLSKDLYATEVSEQILDTMMYHPEVIDLYESNQKKIFISSFINSVVNDEDVTDMIGEYLNQYLLTQKDLEENEAFTARDCRIRTAFSYRFVLETERTKAFSGLKTDAAKDPYFYVQEELDYTVKFLSPKGNNLNNECVRIGLIYDDEVLDSVLRDNQKHSALDNCIFRESLHIEECDREYITSLSNSTNELVKMFRPHLTIDGNKCSVSNVSIASDDKLGAYGIIFEFTVSNIKESQHHDVNIIFHMPKKWNSILEVVIVEPTKAPKISLSYNEDMMNIQMYPFLNKGDNSSCENSLEADNGIYSITLSNEWVFPISGVVFFIQKENM